MPGPILTRSMATDFYSLSQKVPQSIKDKALHHIAKPVFYKGERGVVIAKYWRKQTNEILYDVKCCPEGKSVIVHKKLPEAEVFDWIDPEYVISDCIRYKDQRGWVVDVKRDDQGKVLYRIRIANGGMHGPLEIHDDVCEDEIERYQSLR
jgi:hypothetical protein